MKILPFQEKTVRAALARLNERNVIAIADEAGLGKTAVVIGIIRAMAQRKRRPLRVFYVASNLVLARTNAGRIAKAIEDYFGTGSVHDPGDRILSLRKSRDPRVRVYLAGLTPSTSLTAVSPGTSEERELIRRKKREILRFRSVSGAAVRRELGYRRLLDGWMPDILILDEYQSYVRALEGERGDVTCHSILPLIVPDKSVKTLLVSATPFELRMPSDKDEGLTDERKKSLSFNLFAKALCAYDSKDADSLESAQQKYEQAWANLVHSLASRKAGKEHLEKEIRSLTEARDAFEKQLRSRVLRTFRTDLADVTLSDSGEILPDITKRFFAQLTSTYAIAHKEKGWRENPYIFQSSEKFFNFTEGGLEGMKYALGRGLSSRGRRRLTSHAEAHFERASKGVLAEQQIKAAGIDPSQPRLWVSPSVPGQDSVSEKVMVFSGYRATPIEVCERLKDRKLVTTRKYRNWYLSRTRKPEEAALFWPRPAHILKALGASKFKQSEADEYSLLFLCESGVKRHRRGETSASKIFGTERPKTSWEERTAGAPGLEVLEAIQTVLAAYGINKRTQIELFSDLDVIDALVSMKRGLDHYFGNPYSLAVMENAMGRFASPAALVRKYCQEFGWKPMWVEYFDQLLGPSLTWYRSQQDVVVTSVVAALEEVSRVLNLRYLKKRASQHGKAFTSRTASFLGHKIDKKHKTRPDLIRESFNSPFAPFVLATTSVGEEGLDFHRYCRRQIHWDPPMTASSLAQRIGRVVRYRGLLQRRGFAERAKPTGFIWVEVVTSQQKGGLIPNFQSGKKQAKPSISILAIPFSSQYRKACEVIKHYADLKYFVGMTSEQMAILLPRLVEEISPSMKKRLLRLVIDLGPDERKPEKKSQERKKLAA